MSNRFTLTLRIPTTTFWLLLSACILGLFVAQTTTAQNVQEFFAEKAENAQSQGNYRDAILEYEKLIEQNPQNPEYLFQKAMCYYRLGDYNTSVRLSHSLVDQYPFTDKYYRLLANSYDLQGEYFTALDILEMGNNNIENTGALYLDLGIIEMIRGDKFRAITYWEKGIEKAPDFGENYYWAAKHYANTNEKVWVLIYSEIFLNIERSTDRFNEISKLLYDTYVDLLYKNGGDYELYLPRTEVNNFYDTYRSIIKQIVDEGNLQEPVVVNGATSESHLGGVSQARERFIEIWNESYSEYVSCNLFVYHNDMIRRGLFDSYNHWLMINAKPKYFMSWQKLNTMSYQKFINWFISNKLRIDKNSYIVRMQYEAN